jgi:hypothetical protein
MQVKLHSVCYCVPIIFLIFIYIAVRFLSKSKILDTSSSDEQHSSKSFLEVLKEISRKRIHAQVTSHFL